MNSGIIHLEVEGRKALGFDTGLHGAAFAQAKMNQLLGARGYIVNPQGKVSEWQLEGVVEYSGFMVLWGPDFSGTSLETMLTAGKDTALHGLRCWSRGRKQLEQQGIHVNPGPVQSWVAQDGTVLFLPEALVHRVLIVKGRDIYRNGIEAWRHPDLGAENAAAFTLAAFAYKTFSGQNPFSAEDESVSEEVASDSLRSNIREAVFLPSALAAPGLDSTLSQLIDQALKADPKNSVDIHDLEKILGDTSRHSWDSYFHILSSEEQEKARLAKERFIKLQNRKIGTKRYLKRNMTLIGIAAAVLLGGILVGRSIAASQARKPTTKGMSPIAVVEQYYEAMNSLDHEFMDACVTEKAGESDIRAVMNFFVISKMREAYEHKRTVLSPEEWKTLGGGPIEENVFGISDLTIQNLEGSESEGSYRIQAEYIFWHPSERDFEEREVPEDTYELLDQYPSSLERKDILTLKLHDGAWKISHIEREEKEIEN